MKLVRDKSLTWDIPYLSGREESFITDFISNLFHIEGTFPIKYIDYTIYNSWCREKYYTDFNINNFSFLDYINDGSVTPIFDFSEYNISDEDLNDHMSNLLLDIVMSVNGEVKVSSDKLYRYIKNRYPNARIIASPLLSRYEMEEGKEIDFYNNLLQKYDRVILDPKYVKTQFLNQADKIFDHSRLEIIVNERKLAESSEDPLASMIQAHNKFIDGDKKYRRDHHKNVDFQELYNRSLSLSIEEVDNIAKNTGVFNFKIIKQRNTHLYETAFTITNYILDKMGPASFFAYLMSFRSL